MLRRACQLGADDGLERQVAERALAVPALVTGRRLHPARPRGRVQLLPRLEPLDPREAVPEPATRLRVEEVRCQRLDVIGSEPELREPWPRLLRTQSPPPANRVRP